ncbi:helix-turn-helix domain-containing protein [Tenacibaculum xiamenense]|uniref:helix-turn-helix domain-containing protein n=1 Tax=Tenacibaculum xiamenense TaxID=1261553 RepID=UPI00389463E4
MEKRGGDLAIEHIPDIIISDVMMPIKNGVDLCNELKNDKRTSHIPIILLTAKVGDNNKLEGLKTGADDYIIKPFKKELLKVRVEKLIDNRKKLQARYSQEVILYPKDVAIASIDEQFLMNLQAVLDENLVESSFNIDVLCKEVGMSRMQLHRKLKALTGHSASEFIRSQRLRLASELLKKPGVNISQVGYSVGFNDHAYFSKCFKKMYHCTPTEYQKKIAKNNFD